MEGVEGKLLPQTLFLPPQNKYHLATPFPVLKARAPPKIMRARRGLLIQHMCGSEINPGHPHYTPHAAIRISADTAAKLQRDG